VALTLAQLVAAQRAPAPRPAVPVIQRAVTGKTVPAPKPQKLPAGGFKQALRGKTYKAPNTGLLAITGRLPQQRNQTVAAPAARPAGPPSPKNVSPKVLTGSAAKPLYHAPKPAPAAPRSPALSAGAVRATPISAPAPAAPAVSAPAAPAPGPQQGFVAPTSVYPAGVTPGDPTANAFSGAGSWLHDPSRIAASLPAVSSPAAAAPPAATGAPAAAVPPPAAPDPYAGYPPEIAALLRMTDENATAQQNALQGYFGNQAQAAQDFASAIGTQTGNLAQLAGMGGNQNMATAGIPGAISSLPGELGQIAQHLGAAQGMSTTNAAAMLPGFLRQQGIQAQTGISSANLKAHGQIISDYITRQAELAKVEAQQAGATQREANQAAANVRIQAAHDQIRSAGNILRLLGVLGTNLTKTQVSQIAGQFGLDKANVQAAATTAAAATRAQGTVTAAGIRAAATQSTSGARTQASTAKDYQKIKSKWAGSALAALQGKQVRTGSHKQGTATVYDYGTVGAEAPQQLLTDMLNSGVTPRDAYNITRSAASQLQGFHWSGQEGDFFKALVGSGMNTAKARTTVHNVTGTWVDENGNAIAGPFPG